MLAIFATPNIILDLITFSALFVKLIKLIMLHFFDSFPTILSNRVETGKLDNSMGLSTY